MLLRFTNTDSNGNPTTEELAVTVDGTRYEIETNGSQLVEVPDPVGEYMLAEDYAVEEASDAQNEQQVSETVETYEVDEDEPDREEVAVDGPVVESEVESETENENDNDLPEV